MKEVITRMAPSPTNRMLHIGNLRTLLFNYLFAKKNNGKFLVRLEDTDRDRYTPEFLEHFQETLEWFGMEVDGSYWKPDANIGSFIQSERDYTVYTKYLLDNGYAYYAFDTKEQLKVLKDNNLKYDRNTRYNMCNSFTLSKEVVQQKIAEGDYVIRFAIFDSYDVSFTDSVYGDITINTDNLDDKVLIKSNGIGSYHLCNVCDDHDMNITHVMRGEEWINSTPFHILLYRAFGWDVPQFVHLPNVLTPDGKKLSKRTSRKYGIPISPLGYVDKDTNEFIKGFREEGYEPQALLNYLVFLGWAPNDNTEIMSMSEMIDRFSLDRVHRAGAKMDMDKLKWFNHNYIMNVLPNDYLRSKITINGEFDNDKKNMILEMAKDRSTFTSEMQSIVDLFDKDVMLNSDLLSKVTIDAKTVFGLLLGEMQIINWDKDVIKSKIEEISTGINVKPGKIMSSLRIALTGGVPGPDLYSTMIILGRNETIRRISNVI